MTEHADRPSFFARAIAMVRRIPEGEVTTYGQISLLVSGRVRGARAVGYALAALDGRESETVPWWRVVNREGRISNSNSRSGAHLQRQLLEAEGVEFGADDRIDLSVHGWDGPEGYF